MSYCQRCADLEQDVKALATALERLREVSRIAFSKAASKGNTLAGALAKDFAERADYALRQLKGGQQ